MGQTACAESICQPDGPILKTACSHLSDLFSDYKAKASTEAEITYGNSDRESKPVDKATSAHLPKVKTPVKNNSNNSNNNHGKKNGSKA